MPPVIALFFCIILIGYLFWVDKKRVEGVSSAIWVPFFWMFLAGSRFASQWLGLASLSFQGDDILEGSPLDRAVFTLLILAGILILHQRRINWNWFFAKNAWIWVYFVFGAVSFIWSDYPFVSFKRWVKAIGTLVMVLVIVTEDRPFAAIGIIIRRLAFIFLPLSVVFIKYYPHLGRQYHSWSGTQMFTGVATQKNGLGEICLVVGMYFLWHLLFEYRKKNDQAYRLHYSIYFLLIPIWAWLFYIVNSMTSLVCFIIGAGVLLLAKYPAINYRPKMLMGIVFVCVILFGLLEYVFDFTENMIFILGRRSDLTTRVPMWEDMLSMVKDPLLGYGYESFWLGPRLEYMRKAWGMEHQAHNGYLEMYLNMGLIGILIIICWVFSGLKKIYRQLTFNNHAAILRLSFVVIIVIYNWTEATFYGNNNLWLLFFLGIIDMSKGIKYVGSKNTSI